MISVGLKSSYSLLECTFEMHVHTELKLHSWDMFRSEKNESVRWVGSEAFKSLRFFVTDA